MSIAMLNANTFVHHIASRTLTPKDIMNDIDLCVWVADAKPGDRIIYYRGHLSRDRMMHSEGYAEPVRRKISELGNAAWSLGDENWLHLIQRRIGIGAWEYIAVRQAERPKQKPVYRIIQSLAARAVKEKPQPSAGVAASATGPPPMRAAL
jgi:hypothetical protein